MYKGIQSSLRANKTKSFILMLFFPILLWFVIAIVFAILAISESASTMVWSQARYIGKIKSNEILIFIIPALFIWGILSFTFYRQIIFKFAGARPMGENEFPGVRKIIENLCISRGLSVPNIGIIGDLSMNAFAVGWNSKDAWLVFSSGLLKRLDKSEIEAVAAHELTHIINKDSLLMIVIAVFMGSIEMIGLFLIYGKDKSKNLLFLKYSLFPIGLSLLVLGYVIYPFVWFAISRKREYLADAGSVILTKDKYSMISALQKISKDSEIEQIEKRLIALMCIVSPKFSIFKTNIFSTHPSIENRIKALQSY